MGGERNENIFLVRFFFTAEFLKSISFSGNSFFDLFLLSEILLMQSFLTDMVISFFEETVCNKLSAENTGKVKSIPTKTFMQKDIMVLFFICIAKLCLLNVKFKPRKL